MKTKSEELQQSTINSVKARIFYADKTTRAIREGDLHSLHIAASMDIEETTKSLIQVLEYKKEFAKQMLECTEEKQMNMIAEVIAEADNMIKKILGISIVNEM